jgi:hypothetical protein
MASIWDALFPQTDYRTASPQGGYADLYANGLLGSRTDTPRSVDAMRSSQDFVPVLGDVLAFGEAGNALAKGDRKTAAIMAGAGLLGLVPGVGDALARPVMAAGRKGAELARRIEVDPNAMGSMGGNVRLGAGGNRPPLKSDLDPMKYQNVKMDDYLSDAYIGIEDTGVNLARTPMSWEDMEGKVVLPFYGDRTSGGLLVNSVNDVKFDKPVYTEGGVDFMRGPAAQADKAIWASNQNITKRLSDTADKAAKAFPDRDIVGMTGSMSPDANDFATMTGASVGELVQAKGIPRATAVEFDGIMKSADPNFVGVNSPDLRKWLETTSSPLRKAFIRLADTAPMKAGGFPDMGLGRYAVTDVAQRDMQPGMFGMGVSKIDTSAPRMFNNPKGNQQGASVPHGTYNSQISGDYLGSLPPVPQGLLFRDVYDSMEGKLTKKGQPLTSAHKTHAIKTKVPAQEITPQVLEGILNYMSRLQE